MYVLCNNYILEAQASNPFNSIKKTNTVLKPYQGFSRQNLSICTFFHWLKLAPNCIILFFHLVLLVQFHNLGHSRLLRTNSSSLSQLSILYCLIIFVTIVLFVSSHHLFHNCPFCTVSSSLSLSSSLYCLIIFVVLFLFVALFLVVALLLFVALFLFV